MGDGTYVVSLATRCITCCVILTTVLVMRHRWLGPILPIDDVRPRGRSEWWLGALDERRTMGSA